MAYVKEVAVLLYGWGLGIVGAGQQVSGKEVDLWLGTVQKLGTEQYDWCQCTLTHITEICKDFFLLKFLQVILGIYCSLPRFMTVVLACP